MPIVFARYSSLRLLDRFRLPQGMEIRVNDLVVLQTKRGLEMGQIKALPGEPPPRKSEGVAGDVLRRPSMDDSNTFREFRAADYLPVRRVFRDEAKALKLPIRYVGAEKLLSGDKLIVYFTAEERVDFRELVKALTGKFETRIELRQVGARDAARIAGDVGSCGQELCCVSYIIDFVPVSMKMAKTQRISLDPGKISGMCGRLKCCLKYEDDLYNELKSGVPLEGQPCSCEGVECVACGVDVLGQKVTVDFGDGRRETVDAKEIEFEPGWNEKDVRRFRREQRAKREAEREARRARGDRRTEKRAGGDRRTSGLATETQSRRTTDTSGEVPADTVTVPSVEDPAAPGLEAQSAPPAEETAKVSETTEGEEQTRRRRGRGRRRRKPSGEKSSSPGGGTPGNNGDNNGGAAGSEGGRRRRRRPRKRGGGGGNGGGAGAGPSQPGQ